MCKTSRLNPDYPGILGRVQDGTNGKDDHRSGTLASVKQEKKKETNLGPTVNDDLFRLAARLEFSLRMGKAQKQNQALVMDCIHTTYAVDRKL
jgi:hypothetical protein